MDNLALAINNSSSRNLGEFNSPVIQRRLAHPISPTLPGRNAPKWVAGIERNSRPECSEMPGRIGAKNASRQKYGEFVQEGIHQGFATPWEALTAQVVLGDRDFVEKLKGMKKVVIRGNPKDQPSYRMIERIEAETVMKQAAAYFRLSEAELTAKRGRHREERAVVMELLHRLSGLKQRVIGERFGGLDEGLVSRDRRAIREKMESEPKIRKWVQDLHARLTD
jgi:hypothetical protein